MPVSVVCPACDMEQPADTPGGTIQCRTCWAKVPVPSAPTDTPPPRGGTPIALTATSPASPPRAKRVAEPTPERHTRARREGQPKEKPESWIGAAVLLGVVLIGCGALVAFMWPSAEPDPVPTTTATRKTRPPEPDNVWQLLDAGDGAKLLAPGKLESNEIAVRQGTALRPGTQYTASDAAGNLGEVFRFEHENGDQIDRVASFMEVPVVNATRVGKRAIAGGEGTVYSANHDGYEHTALVVGRDGLWYLFHMKLKTDDETNRGRKEEFLAKAEVTWNRRQDPKPAPKQPMKPAR